MLGGAINQSNSQLLYGWVTLILCAAAETLRLSHPHIPTTHPPSQKQASTGGPLQVQENCFAKASNRTSLEHFPQAIVPYKRDGLSLFYTR